MDAAKEKGLTMKLAATLLCLLALSGCGETERQERSERPPVNVVAAPVEINNELRRIEVVGTSRALQSIILHPASSGEIVAVNFKPGQKVSKDDVLLELDQRKERLAVDLAEHRLSEAERLFERYRKSAETGATLPTTLDAAKTELEAARIELGQARIALEDRNIRAPFSGYVGITDYDPGDRVQVDTPITTLDNRESLMITFELPELLIDHVREGNTVKMRTWEQNSQEVTGEIIEIDSRIDPDLRTFVTRALVDNSNDRLRPGMSFRVTKDIPGDPYPIMPEIAVQWGADGAFVWKIVEGRSERVAVNIVQRKEGKVMVDGEDRLNEHDVIVIEGVQRLRQGLPVSTQEAIAKDSDLNKQVSSG